MDRDAIATAALSKSLGVIIISKGEQDYVSNGEKTFTVNLPGSQRRVGGQGDVLAGAIAAFAAWRCKFEHWIRSVHSIFHFPVT